MRSHRFAPLFFVTLLCTAGPALGPFAGLVWAQEVSLEQMEEARERYGAANAAFQKGEFAAAEEGFQRCYDLLHSPSVLKEIAQAQEKQGKWGPAADSYAAYVRDARPNEAPEIEKRIVELRAKVPPAGAAPVEKPAGLAGDVTKPVAPAEPTPPAGESKRVKPWVWGLVGGAVVVAAGAAVGIAIGVTRGQPSPTTWGDFGPGPTQAALLRF